MDLNQSRLIHKYAQAFYNVYGNEVTLDTFWHIKHASGHLKYIPGVLFFLALVDIEEKKQHEMVEILLQRLQLPESVGRLIYLLMEHHRINLLPFVLQSFINIYQEKKKILLFNITTVSPLDSENKKEIESFLHRLSGCHILSEYSIDNKLIAGIRALNRNYLWEYSIESRIWAVTNSLLEQKA